MGGVRRYQNEDGTLTEEGRRRYMYDMGSGRKMSLVGRIKFGKEATRKTEADEHSKFEKTKHFVDDLDKRSSEMKNTMKNYDKLNAAEKKKFGNKVLDEIEACDDWFGLENYDKDAEWKSVQSHMESMIDWIFDQVKNKSGTSWNNTSVSEGHKKALDEYNKIMEKSYRDRDGNYRVQDEYNAGHKLVSVGLRDIGFEDTLKNRKRCWQYFLDDYYPWYGYDSKHSK